MRRTAAIITLMLSILSVMPSSADGAPYEDAGTNGTAANASPSGTATATADAALTGALTVDATASEDYILPVAVGGGRSDAVAAAGVADNLEVTESGSFIVRATLDGTTASASASEPLLAELALANGYGLVETNMYAQLFDCTGESCTSVTGFGAEGSSTKRLACSTGCTMPDGAIVLEIPIEVPEGVTGKVFVDVNLRADAIARGQSSAAASAATTVTSIELLPAPVEEA